MCIYFIKHFKVLRGFYYRHYIRLQAAKCIAVRSNINTQVFYGTIYRDVEVLCSRVHIVHRKLKKRLGFRILGVRSGGCLPGVGAQNFVP